MKFLAIAKQKDSLMMTPPGTIRQIMEASWKAMQQQKAQGKIVDYFYSPGGYSIVIVEEPTIEDWVRDQMAEPGDRVAHAVHDAFAAARPLAWSPVPST